MKSDPILLGWGLALLLGLPALAARDASRAPEAEELVAHRRAVYLSIAVSLAVVAGATWGVTAWRGVAPERLGWSVGRPAPAGLWALLTAAAGLALAWVVTAAGRRLGLREGRLPRLLMPRSSAEKQAFLLMVALAAVCEEYVFRGFLLRLIEAESGSAPVAVLLSSVSFGLAHGYQRVPGILRATLLGGVLSVPVLVTGSLFAAIIAHFWINALIGLGGWRLLLPDDEVEEPAPGQTDEGGGGV